MEYYFREKCNGFFPRTDSIDRKPGRPRIARAGEFLRMSGLVVCVVLWSKIFLYYFQCFVVSTYTDSLSLC